MALLVKGQRPLGYGINQLRHAKGSSYFYDSLHAEADLIRRHPDKVRNGSVLIYRFNNAPASPVPGKPLCAKPCPLCGHLIAVSGISRVVWFGDNGVAEMMRGYEFPSLTADPVLLTKNFLNKKSQNRHSKFEVENYFSATVSPNLAKN